MRSALSLDERQKYGSEDSPITGFAINRISRTIEPIFTRIQWSAKL